MAQVTALGELLIDFATLETDERGCPTMKANPGGAPGNYLAALAAYGARTSFIGKIGTDAFGDLILGALRRAGVGTEGVVRDASVFTTLAFVTFDEHGDRSFSFARKPGADTMLRPEEIDCALIDGADVFHFGTLSLTDEPARSATRFAVARAKEKGRLVSFDPNLRLPLWRDGEDAKREILWGLGQADIVKISLEELEFLWGCGAEEGAKKLLGEFGVSLVLVTLGAEGSYLFSPRASYRVPPVRVSPVDTTGAGDIFGGSAVSRFLALGKRPEELEESDLRFIGVFASAAASLSTERLGGITSVVPYGEVLSFIGER